MLGLPAVFGAEHYPSLEIVLTNVGEHYLKVDLWITDFFFFEKPSTHIGNSIGVAKKAVREWTNRNHKKILRIHNWTQTGERTYICVLCQKKEGSVEIKQRQTKMGGRTTYKTLSPKRAPFQIVFD
jgi:wobble nucleotide-excising tRNase